MQARAQASLMHEDIRSDGSDCERRGPSFFGYGVSRWRGTLVYINEAYSLYMQRPKPLLHRRIALHYSIDSHYRHNAYLSWQMGS